MNGTQRANRAHQRLYLYQCWPGANNRGRVDNHHRTASYLREDAILDAITRFYAERCSARPGRHSRRRPGHRRRPRRRRTPATTSGAATTHCETIRRRAALLRQAHDITDPDDPWAKGLRRSYNDLDAETAALTAVADLDTADAAEPTRSDPGDVTLLDQLPYLRLNLAEAPEPLLRACSRPPA